MVTSLGRTSFGILAALLVSGTASAQEAEFEEAVKLLRMGQKDEALAKFREVLQADPSSEDALRIYRNTDPDVWYSLVLEDGEIGQIAQALLDRAKMQRRQLSRDEAAIGALVEAACSGGDLRTRNAAIRSLAANHGQFAVPALVRRLAGGGDSGQINAIVALYNLGRAATLPLIEVLGSEDPEVRRSAAAALSQIGDPRAAGALARLVQVDAQESVRDVARRTLPELGVAPNASPVALLLADARAHLGGDTVSAGAPTEVVWTLADGELTYSEVPAAIYGLELAKKNAHSALVLDPLSDQARMILAQAYLAEIAVIQEAARNDAGDPELAQLFERVDGFRRVVLAAGPATLQTALDDALARDWTQVAVGAIEALELAGADAAARSRASLAEALESSDSRISYPAALALAATGDQLPANESRRVVEALGAAVSEKALRVIKVIDSTPTTRRVAQEASGRGSSFQVADSAVTAIGELNRFPNVDVVVINEVLDRLPEDVIGLIRRDARMADVRILVVASDVDAAADRFGDTVDGVIQGPLDSQTLRSEVDSVLADADEDSVRARADKVAVEASHALRLLAESTNVSVAPALDNLAAQLDRNDEIAINAARAIGHGGGMEQLGALVAVIRGDTSGTELKIACADAAGRILGRSSGVPTDIFEGLLAVLETGADNELLTAVATALGKAPLVPGNRLRLMELLRVTGG